VPEVLLSGNHAAIARWRRDRALEVTARRRPDLIGLEVLNREGVLLGRVVGLLDTGPHSVLRIQPETAPGSNESADERLIPFVAAYVDAVDLPGRRITVDWGPDF
jgi:16S rRNA processing protein RimM